MFAHDFEQSVGYWLLTTAHSLERSLNIALDEHGITYRQFQVLACLAVRKELTQAEIAEMLGVEPSTVVRVLDPIGERRLFVQPIESNRFGNNSWPVAAMFVEEPQTGSLTRKLPH